MVKGQTRWKTLPPNQVTKHLRYDGDWPSDIVLPWASGMNWSQQVENFCFMNR